MTTHLVWFRQDLRLHDNLALAAACRNSSARVLALYIATPRQWETHNMSPRQAELINAQLNGCIDSLEVRKKPGGHWIIRDLMGLDLVGLASL